MSDVKKILPGFWWPYVGAGLFVLIVFAPFLTGSTFGQRCAKYWDSGTPEHELCVHEMAEGLRDFPSQPLLQEPTHE